MGRRYNLLLIGIEVVCVALREFWPSKLCTSSKLKIYATQRVSQRESGD